MTNSDNETKIKLIEDRDAAGEVAAVYDEWGAKSGRQKLPGILKCFSKRQIGRSRPEGCGAFGISPQG
ncbi:MAG: hypothetical protein ABSG96_16330 [Terracidiphilus sp.]